MLFSATGMIIPDKIRVGCDRDYPPLSSLVEGKPSGFDVELMGLLSEQSGVPFIILPDYWSQVIEDLKTGRIDAVSGILKTDQRAPYFDFTLPYLTENYALFSHHGSNIRGLGDLPGKSAAILRNDAAVSTFFIPNKLEDNLILTESFTQALKLVAENQTDYTIAPLSLGKSILKSLGLERRIKISRTLFPVEYRMAVTRGNRELLFLLNESIARLQKSGELQELIRKKHISVPHSISTVPPASPLLIGSGILLVLMFLGIILGRSLLRYRIEKAVKEVTAAKEYFESLLEEIPLPLYWRDKTFQITGSNKRMRAFLHAEKTGSQDKTPAPGADESDFSGFFGEMERADVLTWNTGQAQDLKLQTSPGTGSIHSYLYRSLPIGDASGNSQGLLGVLQDTSQVELLEKNIESLSAILAQKKGRRQRQLLVDRPTGLFNRDYLQKQLEEEAAHFARYLKPFSVILFEIRPGGTKEDHPALPKPAEKAPEMKLMGDFLKSVLRSRDQAGRWDEARFLIILPQTGKAEARTVTEKIRQALEPLWVLRSALAEFHGQGTTSLMEEVLVTLKTANHETS